MRNYIILFFSLICFLAACNSSDTPDGIIEPDRMVGLLTEVHLADGTNYNLKQDKDTLYKYALPKYLSLFKKYHTDSVHFRQSMKYYSSNPPVMLEIYNKILDNLKAKTDSLNKVTYKSAVDNAKPHK